jgi:NAD+ synthase (glutamine-hydrolysing)
MKIGVAQINSIVGDLDGNLNKIIQAYKSLCEEGSELIVFPELCICGYPPRDLLQKEQFGEDCRKTLEYFAKQTGSCPALIGFPHRSGKKGKEPFFNAVALCVDKDVRQYFHKQLLPTYDVFDEDRYFSRGSLPAEFNHLGKKIAVTICEDIWNASLDIHTSDPLEKITESRPDLLINLSASPWHIKKQTQREVLLKKVSQRVECPVVYVNAVGGNDELIFDGSSVAFSAEGKRIGRAPSFVSASMVFDLDSAPATMDEEAQGEMESIRQALVLGLRDYAHKSGFTRGIIGLSGGIDSAVTAALAVEALGKENVIGISLPSAISSGHSRDDARLLAENLGIEYHTLPIQKIVDSAEHELAPLFAGLDTDVTEENLQARSRGLLLMAVSNKLGALLLTTGNKSELAVGYCTLYGDMCGGLAVISDLPKTKVFQLARHINREREIIPNNSIEKPPSAELRPDQKDSDSLPDYQVLDGILEGYVEQGLSIHSLIELGFQEETVRKIVSLVDRNEYKRKQAAPGLKVTPLAFGIGRRMPIVQKYSN